jgi:hypothetical protein
MDTIVENVQKEEAERLGRFKRVLWKLIREKTTWGRNELIQIIKSAFAEVYGIEEEPPPF